LKLDWRIVAGLGAAGLLVARRAEGAAMTDSKSIVEYSAKIRAFAEAIAYAEGYYAPGNPIPRRLNNPGDLKISSVPNIGKDASGHLHFATAEDGWLALYRQLQLIINGRSSVYTLDMTIAQMGARYAEANDNWVTNVTRRLGVTPQTRLRDVLV
jgi:hypothetical protein